MKKIKLSLIVVAIFCMHQLSAQDKHKATQNKNRAPQERHQHKIMMQKMDMKLGLDESQKKGIDSLLVLKEAARQKYKSNTDIAVKSKCQLEMQNINAQIDDMLTEEQRLKRKSKDVNPSNKK